MDSVIPIQHLQFSSVYSYLADRAIKNHVCYNYPYSAKAKLTNEGLQSRNLSTLLHLKQHNR